MRKLLAIGTIAFVAFTMSNVPVLRAQALAELMPTGKIPPNKYKTYSLFLVCNPQWLAADKSEGLFALYQNFQNFGRTIGDENLAVWFINGYASKADSGIAAKSDVGRSVHFCQAWKLKPSAGPHLVITAAYPDESKLSTGLPADSAVFELGNMKPSEISDLLTKLTDELIQKGHVDGSAAASQPPPGMWVQLLESTQHLINSFGCAWNFKIDAGPVKADLRSCQKNTT